MGIVSVREQLKRFNKEIDIIEFKISTATVIEAANALNTEPARIAKTLAFKVNDKAVLIVMTGDARIDNSKYKAYFNTKAKMLTPDEVREFTGHEVGGVCPFGLKNNLDIYLDDSLKRFVTVFPACGNANSAIEISISELENITKPVAWVDVTRI
ncbi:MAG: YbaK/EbsC family protein [Bacilli bacterium]|nr:YbaK/EbsC family protein [Bacilli bacterium]MDD4608452.1 YbaK/EbsC family protein [Bacilli bacterium]